MDRDAIALALHRWRRAEELLAEPMFDDERQTYEIAIAAIGPELDDIRSVADLVELYGDGDAWADLATAACAAISERSDREMLPRVVADVAFWRRCRTLVEGALAG